MGTSYKKWPKMVILLLTNPEKFDFFLNFLNKDRNKRNIIIQENLE